MTVRASIGVGANLGDAARQVLQAIADIAALPQTRLSAQSSLFASVPLDADGDDYVNAVVQVDTELSALALLQALQALERQAGRERPYPNAPRTLDLDLLLFGSQQITTAELSVPHPRMTSRAFVLIPLLQIDPMTVIPGRGQLHQFLPAVIDQAIRKIAD
jgi:2-amino-4-hydroxy-6-hydroxymethyldihydropteridine diphosphokinase